MTYLSSYMFSREITCHTRTCKHAKHTMDAAAMAAVLDAPRTPHAPHAALANLVRASVHDPRACGVGSVQAVAAHSGLDP